MTWTEGTDTSTVPTEIPDSSTTVNAEFEATTEPMPETETASMIVSVSLTTSEQISASNVIQSPEQVTTDRTESEMNATETSAAFSDNLTETAATVTQTPLTTIASESETVEMTDTTETVTETVLDTTLPVELTSTQSSTTAGPSSTPSDLLSLEDKPVNPDPVDNFLHSFSEMLAQSEPTSVSASSKS